MLAHLGRLPTAGKLLVLKSRLRLEAGALLDGHNNSQQSMEGHLDTHINMRVRVSLDCLVPYLSLGCP